MAAAIRCSLIRPSSLQHFQFQPFFLTFPAWLWRSSRPRRIFRILTGSSAKSSGASRAFFSFAISLSSLAISPGSVSSACFCLKDSFAFGQFPVAGLPLGGPFLVWSCLLDRFFSADFTLCRLVCRTPLPSLGNHVRIAAGIFHARCHRRRWRSRWCRRGR